ncbi:hypothetical protein [Mycobacterium vicinigordonae]|uniref:Uncharacterized protein n=1 Tax=Mycobacterium vicinigordonae TaxID=1719132 RepID=A0A7D6HR50_9MYCO|nr:hypothetical protein [Mycobacterium vicinigordonae]QLL05332.1 hypothetical protein H0P51_15740 [Mycobacterium vicinigordonae]
MTQSFRFTDSQIRLGAGLGLAHVVGALIAHWNVPTTLEEPLGLRADPWFRRETGTVNAGFAYGLIRVLRGHQAATFLKTTALSGALMAATRTIATLRGKRRGPLSALVILSDLILSIGGFVLAHQFEHNEGPGFQPLQPRISYATTGEAPGQPAASQSTKKAAER